MGDFMSEEIEFLNYIYQNAQMGKESIGHILKRDNIGKIKETLEEQKADYVKICNSARGMIERRKKKAKDIGVISQMMTYMSVNANLNEDMSDSHIAEMLMKGSGIGIKEITKKIAEYKKVSKPVINIANRLLYLEEQNIDNLKKFVQK